MRGTHLTSGKTENLTYVKIFHLSRRKILRSEFMRKTANKEEIQYGDIDKTRNCNTSKEKGKNPDLDGDNDVTGNWRIYTKAFSAINLKKDQTLKKKN